MMETGNKISIHTDEKVLIFAQYFTKGIYIFDGEHNFVSLQRDGRLNRSQHNIDHCKLTLHPLSSITDSDAVEILKLVSGKEYVYELTRVDTEISELEVTWKVKAFYEDDKQHADDLFLTVYFSDCCFILFRGLIYNKAQELTLATSSIMEAYQYLQFKGYALPYRQYSVEQLVELGVYKLLK